MTNNIKSRVTHSSYVIDFLGVGFNTNEISRTLENKIDHLLFSVNYEKLDNWELQFNALYTSGEKLELYRKTRSYTVDKVKEIVVHIPIPLITEVDWGVNLEQHIKLGHNPKSLKYVDFIDIDPTKFDNRTTYIMFCLDKAVETTFQLGFTMNGCKIKT